MWMYLVLCCILQKTSSIRLVSIQIPERVLVGEGVGLSCVYDLEGDVLYNIKWYLDGVEFFRFVPNDRPSRLFFPVKGIQVDLERSGNGTVFIQDVKTNTSGKYGCEISADAPSFQTLQAEKMMAVEEVEEAQSNTASGKATLNTFSSLLVLLVLVCFDDLRRVCLVTRNCPDSNDLNGGTIKDTHHHQPVHLVHEKHLETSTIRSDSTSQWNLRSVLSNWTNVGIHNGVSPQQ